VAYLILVVATRAWLKPSLGKVRFFLRAVIFVGLVVFAPKGDQGRAG